MTGLKDPTLQAGALSGGPGAITVHVALADGYVRRAEIGSTRPLALSRLFVGRPADEAPVLAGSLFSLCGFSHAVAARLAVSRARGQAALADAGGPRLQSLIRGILAERAAEYLRSLVTGGADGQGGAAVDGELLALLRDALAAARELTALPVGGRDPSRDDTGQAVSRLVAAARRLGDGTDPATPMGAMLKRAYPEEAFLVRAPDALTADDDEAVIGQLHRTGPIFAALPSLPGRVVETGAFARSFPWDTLPRSAIAARLAARLTDLARTADCLEAGRGEADRGEAGTGDGLWLAAGLPSARDSGGQGYCAVESPRGRLYHWVALNQDGTIGQYAIIAPTEWNFHPNGPFIGNLLGAKVGDGEDAKRRISWLAAMFDPCVAFRVVLTENGGGHA